MCIKLWSKLFYPQKYSDHVDNDEFLFGFSSLMTDILAFPIEVGCLKSCKGSRGKS